MDSYTENDIKKGQAVPDLFGVAKKIQQTVSAVFAFWIPQTLSEEFVSLPECQIELLERYDFISKKQSFSSLFSIKSCR